MINDFFTIPDLDLTQESSVDPMGLQVIWTQYGQAIFNEKLTINANDLRVYTFNLFHHHLINRLDEDHRDEIQQATSYYRDWKTEFDFRSGLLIFLEDLVTHIFYKNAKDGNDSIDTIGILGMSKARILDYTKTHDQIFLSASKRQGLLKNQLNLGMSGRYKGPMISMKFFNRTYSQTSDKKIWEGVNQLINSWTDVSALEEKILQLIVKDLFDSANKEYPLMTLNDLFKNSLWKPISEGYIKCFGKRKLPKSVKDYWKDHLGLLSGAPYALFNEISILPDDENLNHQQIFLSAAKQLRNEPEEIQKVNNVLSIEPFLSHSEYLFRYLAQPSIKNINEEEKNIKLLRTAIVRSANFSVEKPESNLMELRRVMLVEDPYEQWLKGILSYHKNIMDRRGGSIWVDLDEQNNVKHYFAPSLSEDLNTVKKYLDKEPWWHTYYLETLRSISQGMK